MTPDASTKYYFVTAKKVDNSGRLPIAVRRAQFSLQGSANETDLPITDTFTNTDA